MSGRCLLTAQRVAARRRRIFAVIGGAIILSVIIGGCGADSSPAARGPATVRVEVVGLSTLADRREYVGNVRSVDRVEIRARVRGYLIEQRFEDGARVRKGALLFRIDPRPFEVALAEARGRLARARAEAVRAARDLERAEVLFENGVLSPGLIDERRAARDASAAAEQAAQAAVESAELDLSYAEVRAPVAGRMGRALVDVGNLVGESGQDTVLAELFVEDPARVYFAVPEVDAIERLDTLSESGDASADASKSSPRVGLLLADGSRHPHEGVVDYVEPSVDATRGTVSLRARVPNPEGRLRPGQFVRVLVEFPGAAPVVSIAPRAVLDEQGGSHVLVVKPDDTVERRPVRPGRMVDGRQEILSGLSRGERVVVDGVQSVRPGDAVRIEPVANGPAERDAEKTSEASSVRG